MCPDTPGEKKYPKIISFLLLPLVMFWDTTLQPSGTPDMPRKGVLNLWVQTVLTWCCFLPPS